MVPLDITGTVPRELRIPYSRSVLSGGAARVRRPFSIPGVIGCTLVVAATGLLRPEEMQLPPVNVLLAMLGPALIVGIPFGYWLPVARVPFFRAAWRVPQDTFLLSRPLVCLICTSMIGTAFGSAVLAVWCDSRFGIMCGMQVLPTAAFLIAASRRFRHPPSHEFVMRFRLRM